MNRFDYYNPVRVHFGVGEINNIATVTKALGTKVCLVSYKELGFGEALMQRITALLEQEGITVYPFYEVEANPEITMVERGAACCKAHGVEVVIGVGGGSAMDAAKVIAAGVYYDRPLWEMVNARHDGKGGSVPPIKALPLVMVPTLPATGSEMNQCAVVSNTALQEKSYIWAECLFPTAAIIDPTLTASLPPLQSAYAAADTISHVLEIYLNGEEDSDLQHYFQEGVMRTVMENIEKVLEDPNAIAARAHLQWAATCAINGWASPGDAWTPIHQVGHVLTSRHKVPHGASLALLMPVWMELFWRRKPQQYYRFATLVMQVSTAGKEQEQVIQEGVESFRAFLSKIGVGFTLADWQIGEEDLPAILNDVVKVSFGADGLLACNPPMRREDIMLLLQSAL